MKIIFPRDILLACVLALAILPARADEEQSQIEILQSGASPAQKWAACQKLRVIGTAKAAPAVAVLLTDPALSQAARQTLEGLPYPEADAALREALGKTDGLVKAGIIDSIGWRGQAAAASQLIPLLAEVDTNVASAAAIALGRLGGEEAVAALSAARDKPPVTVQYAAQASLLQCAERLAKNNELTGAAAIYRELYADHYPLGIRTAAWRGLVLTDAAERDQLMNNALTGTDRPLQRVALKVLRESNDRPLLQACFAQWASLPTAAQLALLDAESRQGPAALPMIRAASQSVNAALRAAAWNALGQLNDLESLAPLAKAAAGGEAGERQAARDSLARLSGPGALEALLTELKQASVPEKAELLRALGTKPDSKAADVLLQNAADSDAAVRKAALQSLKEMAPPQALSPLLEIAQSAGSDDIRQLAVEALSAICQTTPDKDAATHAVVEAEGRWPAADRAALLPLLDDLATAGALAAAQEACRSQDADLAKEAVRTLSQWPNAAPAVFLLELAGAESDGATRTLALRGAIAVSALEPAVSKRLSLLTDALGKARRPDEKKLVLSQLGRIPASEALEAALKTMDDPGVSKEAALAALSIAEKLGGSNAQLANEAAAKVLSMNKGGELFQRAWALRSRPAPAQDVPFIRDWLVCGPYLRQGVTGATAVFKVPFGPEIEGQQVEWKTGPAQDHVNLGELFPGAQNCAAYLRTSVVAPEDCAGVLLMGSDDGIKAWLNGAVVHSHNVDRGEVVDQDAAPISLKKGANELVLKISQGGGGWSACVRIAGQDGRPLEGLRVERPNGAAGHLSSAE